MRRIDIKQKLRELGVTVEGVCLGDFDLIGELTAKKSRAPDDPNYTRYGAFFRPNYERGILLYHLIRTSGARRVLEIGFGRGYGALCAAKAFHDSGVVGSVISVDPSPAGCQPHIVPELVKALRTTFPALADYVDIHVGTSQAIVPRLDGDWDLVYIDGDHSEEGTRADWELVRDRWNKHVLFDDYHLPTKDDPGIRCSAAIDAIVPDGFTKELIVGDRRMFPDDRGLRDDQIDYGQVLLTKEG